ncbi:hypothetical protein WJM97_22850 (plasmid) [Okeanomitos corallinicola TIOX110]|uniref:Uncharacterized protein n=1 Tax=Okeanomitos corallinicola TIOX110 TaxID=3133117 RepID=A0ABZ2UZU4_9CYAN
MTAKKQQKYNDHNRRCNSNGNGQFPQTSDTEKQYKSLSVRLRAYSNTVDGHLITYLHQGNGLSTSKEMALQALRIYWLPLAYKAQVDAGVGINDQEVRRISLICCHALEQHLAYLRMELGLPNKSSDVLPVNLSTIANPQNLATMFLDTGNSSKNDHESSKSQVISNNNQPNERIDSDSFIPGKGSFHDDNDDMFADI